MNNPFLKPVEYYQRDIDVLKNAKIDSAHILMRARGVSFEKAMAFVERQFAAKVVNPEVKSLVRGANGDRHRKSLSLSSILDNVQKADLPMSPSFIIYEHPDVKKSILSKGTLRNVTIRSKFKKEKEVAKIQGDYVKMNISENKQQGRKRSNNSLSGAQVSKSTILYGPTAHTALTSTCRSTAGYGNANNEKFIAGNRHYWSEDIVLANIASICNITESVPFESAMTKFSVHYPTVEEVLEMIERSTHYYWDIKTSTKIPQYVEALSPLERAMVMYVGDAYHLSKYNYDLMGDIIRGLASEATVPATEEEIAAISPQIKGDLWVLTNYVAKNFVRNRKHDELMQDKESYAMYCGTAKNTLQTIARYADLISAFWTTGNMPASVAELPSIVRRAVVASDTDSTIFTLAYWTARYCDERVVNYTNQSENIRDAMVFLCSQNIIHVLAMMSVNMGGGHENLHALGMKNEYIFPVFMVTNATKHYVAYQGAVEGIVNTKLALELKGVNLKASTSPPELVEACHNLGLEIMDRVMDGKGMSIKELMTRIADYERGIIDSIRLGKAEFLKRVTVKSAESYKQGESQPTYKAHVLWGEVFGPSYQKAPELPYRALKFNADVTNKTSMNAWLDRFTNQDCKARMIKYMEDSNSKMIKTIIIPESIVTDIGVPDDIMANMNVRKTIATNMRCFYVLLTTLKLYYLDKKNSSLISDYF